MQHKMSSIEYVTKYLLGNNDVIRNDSLVGMTGKSASANKMKLKFRKQFHVLHSFVYLSHIKLYLNSEQQAASSKSIRRRNATQLCDNVNWQTNEFRNVARECDEQEHERLLR